MAELTDKQKRFVEEYLIDLNATQAAIRAGYSAKSAEVEGSRQLRNAKVASAVRAAQGNRSERTEITQDWVLSKLHENVQRAMQATEIRNADGGTGEYKYDGSVANRALELLGKHLGMFVDRGEIKHVISHEDALEGLE